MVCCCTQVMCNSTELRESTSGVLFGAAKRCLGLQPSCELLSQPGDLLNSTTTADSSGDSTGAAADSQLGDLLNATTADSSDENAGTAADSQPQQQQQEQQDRNSTQGSAATTNSTSTGSSGSSQQDAAANLGNSLGMNELAAALQAQADAPHMAPDPFMPLVPRPVETAASVIVLATPEEIDEAAARNGSRSRIVASK
jgi:hypothetical protein